MDQKSTIICMDVLSVLENTEVGKAYYLEPPAKVVEELLGEKAAFDYGIRVAEPCDFGHIRKCIETGTVSDIALFRNMVLLCFVNWRTFCNTSKHVRIATAKSLYDGADDLEELFLRQMRAKSIRFNIRQKGSGGACGACAIM